MSGARNCPETPRQKMIGMMYLVLTAMLALNVSSEILNGFSMIDTSLHKNIDSSNARNSGLYADFKALDEKNHTKVGEWLNKAKLVKEKSDNLYNYIESFKKKIVNMADGKEANDSAYVFQIKAKDNLDKASEYGVVGGHGKILKKNIEDYRDFLIKISNNNPAKVKLYQSVFSTAKTKDGREWTDALFEMMPLSAVVTILTKYQNDIRSSEAEIIEYLKVQTDASDFRANKLEAFVIPDSRYVIRGDRFKARIVLSAVDSTKVPNYYVNGALVPKGLYETTCTSSGPKVISGQITFVGNDGELVHRAFKNEYTVVEPTATMSNEDLNVVYKGIDNKFSVSVPGVAPTSVSIKVEGGNAEQKAPGKYIIRTTRDGNINIHVFALIDKAQRQMGSQMYRVKLLPDPKAFIQMGDNNSKVIRSGMMTQSELRSSAVIASYGNDELVKANFRINSFTMVAKGIAPTNVNGNKMDRRFIDKLLKGDILVISQIKAEGPDRTPRDIGSIMIQL